MNKLDKDYQNLLQDILDNGIKKEDTWKNWFCDRKRKL